MINLPEIIRIVRIQEKLSQEDFGEKWGVNGSTIAKWESGSKTAPYEVIAYALEAVKAKVNVPEVCPTCHGDGIIGLVKTRTPMKMNLSDEERAARAQRGRDLAARRRGLPIGAPIIYTLPDLKNLIKQKEEELQIRKKEFEETDYTSSDITRKEAYKLKAKLQSRVIYTTNSLISLKARLAKMNGKEETNENIVTI